MKMINVFKLSSMYCICPKCGFNVLVDEREDEI
ncbi:DUF3797 domain-containing protein [Clostridioides difficile]|nr:DUF3797 domain-containing protein [Clostridioides difficile]MDI6392382.1 DUF3797 domain-containing protein [Clostridioides difficile]MDN9637730.1 DUF3797 domain-containing protein [Clostridioides difficile]HBF9224953.1 DUF3797 domain-containing protein [Clostridioides difficile]HEK5031720.1 DUF3797 domain-containing protein [Clostridioides difficile]